MATKKKKQEVHVEYEDGSADSYRIKPRHLVRFEIEEGEMSESMTAVFKLAWMASGTKKGFEAWLDTVADIGMGDDDGEDEDILDGVSTGDGGEKVPT